MRRLILFLLLMVIVTPVSANHMTSDESYMWMLINEERAKRGIPELQYDYDLIRQARIKSRDMHDNNYFDHISPTLGSPFEQLQNAGIDYKWAGENIAKARSYTVEEVMQFFMDSPDHRANILSAGYTHVGVGIYNGYYTQVFMKPRHAEVKGVSSTNSEIDLMARMVAAESGAEPFEGQIAVAAVILNRVKDYRFPNTITDVLFQRNQFEPILTGSLWEHKASERQYKAVQIALEGYDPSEGSLFFLNPDIAWPSSTSWLRRNTKFVKRIGNHEFRTI